MDAASPKLICFLALVLIHRSLTELADTAGAASSVTLRVVVETGISAELASTAFAMQDKDADAGCR
jgi:hypothetical protein